MALPENTLSSSPLPAPFLSPSDRTLRDPLVAYERGGIAIQDTSQGLDKRSWKAFADSQGIWLQSMQTETPVLYIPGEEINYVSLAFDQNMNPVIVYRQLEVVKMSWYDPLVGARSLTEYPNALVGAVTLDDKRAVVDGTNDVLFIYVRDEGIFYRQQRDRYTVERFLAPLPEQFINVTAAYCEEDYCEVDYTGMHVWSLAPAIHLNVGMNTGLRLQIELAA